MHTTRPRTTGSTMSTIAATARRRRRPSGLRRILGRYDHGAIPHAVYSVVRDLEIEISELQIKASR